MVFWQGGTHIKCRKKRRCQFFACAPCRLRWSLTLDECQIGMQSFHRLSIKSQNRVYPIVWPIYSLRSVLYQLECISKWILPPLSTWQQICWLWFYEREKIKCLSVIYSAHASFVECYNWWILHIFRTAQPHNWTHEYAQNNQPIAEWHVKWTIANAQTNQFQILWGWKRRKCLGLKTEIGF